MLEIIPTFEHKTVGPFTEGELVALEKDKPKVVDEIGFKDGNVKTGYFIGLEYLADTGKALCVKPKLDQYSVQTNFLEMLGFCLQHPEVYLHTGELFGINFTAPPIRYKREADLITPLIIVQFLNVVRRLVKSGLRRSYYRVTRNIRSSVKGKILVGKTIKQNHFHNKSLHSYCTYDEFGINTPENRVIKKALIFANRYSRHLQCNGMDFSASLGYIMPAFDKVDGDIQEDKIKGFVSNPFFKDYNEAIYLAKLVLKRFGYNINAVDGAEMQLIPPFWIDMAKLFELYVLGKLKEVFDFKGVVFQAEGKAQYIDFLRTTYGSELIIDAKYKRVYKDSYDIDDIRQLSGYARDRKILEQLECWKRGVVSPVVKCLIVYPDQDGAGDIVSEDTFANPIKEFEEFYKVGLRLPVMNT